MEVISTIFDCCIGLIAKIPINYLQKKINNYLALKSLKSNLKQKYGDDYDYYITEAITIFQRAPLDNDDFIKSHQFNVKKIVSVLCDHLPQHHDDENKIREILENIISTKLQQRDNYATEQLLTEQSSKFNEILSIFRNNNYGLEEQEIKRLVRFYLQQNKSITEIEQAIKDFEQLKQDFNQLKGEEIPEVKKAMQEAENHINNGKIDDAVIAIKYALSQKGQYAGSVGYSNRKFFVDYAKIYAIEGNTYRQKFAYQQARDSYIEAYKTITDNLSNNQCDDDIRRMQIAYLSYITDNSIHAGLYNDNKTNHYAELAVSFAKEYFGDDHPNMLTSLNSLALLYKRQRHYDKAEPLYNKALEKRTEILGRDHHETLVSLNNLALLYGDQGRYEEAEPLYIEALEKNIYILGRDNPNTLICINNLAGLYESQGHYDKAEPLYTEALDLKTKILGRDHPSTLTSLNNLATLYQAQERYDEAEPLHQEELETCTRILGRDHPNTLTSINNLALLYSGQGYYDKAEPLYMEALAGLKKVFPSGHPYIEITENNLKDLREKMKEE